MDIKDLRPDSGLGTNNSNANYKFPSKGKMSQTERSTNVELHSSIKVDMQGARPCAIIGPDRVLPPTISEGYSKSGPDDLWPCPDSYRQFYDHPIKMSDFPPSRNISPRQTFQENMQRIMVPPMYSSNKNSEESSLKNTKLNMPPEAKYCDVPFTLSNEPKTVRNVDVPMNNISPAFTRNIPPNGWQPGVSVRPLRPYPVPEFYQYPEYPSCAGTRPVPMVRPQRVVPEEAAQSYSERLYQEANIRFKPYPSAKDRYPQARYEYISNCPTSFHSPAPYQPHKFDVHKSIQGHPYPAYPQVPLKYLERRMPEPIIDGFQRPPNPHANMNTFRNHMIPPPYGPIPGSCYQNKAYPYPSDGAKSGPLNKLSYDTNNKVYLEYDNNNRNKVYPAADNFYYNDQSQLLLPGHPVLNSRSQHSMYRKENSLLKNYDYAVHYRNIEQSMNVHHSLSRLPLQFSPNSIAISPSDSNTSNDTAQTIGNSQEDCGYVSQSSTTSLKSLDSCLANDIYKRYDYMPYGSFHHQTNKNEINLKTNINSSDKKGLNVRQFLQMWNEGDEEGSNNTKEIMIQNKSTNCSSKFENGNNQEQLYVLGLVNVPSEDLCKYDHLQKISKLPENIKGYNNIELLNQYEQLVESPTMSNFQVKAATMKEFQVSTKNITGKIPKEVINRPLSPLDVEAKISQSVIHKEVGCNFEIKPCSPKILNVDAATPVQDILGERIIEKVTNTGLMGSKMITSVTSMQPSCDLSNKQFSIDSIKTNNYNLQDLDTNSSVCLASLPQLDNDIDLNFPEVNQQFINANKAETPLSTRLKDLTHINIDTKVDFHQNLELVSHCVPNIGAEKESTKLSKYRKIKKLEVPSRELESVYNRLSPMQQRTDSVIIKNPENIKTHECEDPSPPKRNDGVNHIIETEKPYFSSSTAKNRISGKLIDDPSVEMAIDFSLNKNDTNIPENGFNVKKSTDFLSVVLINEDNKYDLQTNDTNCLKLNNYEHSVHKGIDNFKLNSETSRDHDLLNESQNIVNISEVFKENRDRNGKWHVNNFITEDGDGITDNKKEKCLNEEVKNIKSLSPRKKTHQEKISKATWCDNQLSKTNCNDTHNNICEISNIETNEKLSSKATNEIKEQIIISKEHSFVSESDQVNTKDDLNSLTFDNKLDVDNEEKPLNENHENVNKIVKTITINNEDLSINKKSAGINITDKSLKINSETQFAAQSGSLDEFDTKTNEKRSNDLNVVTEISGMNIDTCLEFTANNINQINTLDIISTDNNETESSKFTTKSNLENENEILNAYDTKDKDKSCNETGESVFTDLTDVRQTNLDITSNNKIISSNAVLIENYEGKCDKNNSETCFNIQNEEGIEEKNESYEMDLKNMMDIIYNRTEITTNKDNEINLSDLVLEENDYNSSKISTEAILGVLSESCDIQTEEKSLNKAGDFIVKEVNIKENNDSDLSSKIISMQSNAEISATVDKGICLKIQSVRCHTSGLTPQEKYSHKSPKPQLKNVVDELNQDRTSGINQNYEILFTDNILFDKNKSSIQVHEIVSESNYSNIVTKNYLENEGCTSIDSPRIVLGVKNEDSESVTSSSLNALENDEGPVLSRSINEDKNEYALNVGSDIQHCLEKHSTYSKIPEPLSLTKRYPSKEYNSPWMQKLYLFTEGICTSIKINKLADKEEASNHINDKNSKDISEDQKIEVTNANVYGKNKMQQIEIQPLPLKYHELIDNIANPNVKETAKDSVRVFHNKDCVIADDQKIPTYANNATEKCKLSMPFCDYASKLKRKALKRSLSESALDTYSTNDTTELAFVKRPKIISTDISNIFQNQRRNSISEIHNEDNFIILIEDNNYILTDENETEKICYTEVVSMDSDSEINEGTVHMVAENELKYCSESYESPSLIAIVNDIEEKSFDESWVDDVACVETIYSDDIAENIEISSPVSPNTSVLSNCQHDTIVPLHGEKEIEHMEKVKDIYGRNMCNDDAQIVETLFRTPQMNVNKTLVDNIESHNTEEIETCNVITYDSIQDTITVSNLELPAILTDDTVLPCIANDSKIEEDKEVLKAESILQSDASFSCKSENDTSIEVFSRTQHELDDYSVHSCASSNYDIECTSDNKILPNYCVSSSPEVTSTTSEEKNSGILLKISSYNGSRISRIKEVDGITKNNKLSYKLTENIHYKSFNSNSSGILITKAAQKYIPPLKETMTDLKVKLTLPQHSLMKLKELKQSKVQPKIDKKLPKQDKFRYDVAKKQKPKFEDVLMDIDKIQYKMHKEKARKVKEEIPKVVIKKTESGAHYASSSSSNTNDKIYNPDLTGRKWQPWVFLEKNDFIDKMAVKNKQKAVFCHRKNSYVLSEKFRKYKSIYNAKFIISQPLSDDSTKGNLKYTIRLKHL